jgi:hypothetical protein
MLLQYLVKEQGCGFAGSILNTGFNVTLAQCRVKIIQGGKLQTTTITCKNYTYQTEYFVEDLYTCSSMKFLNPIYRCAYVYIPNRYNGFWLNRVMGVGLTFAICFNEIKQWLLYTSHKNVSALRGIIRRISPLSKSTVNAVRVLHQ